MTLTYRIRITVFLTVALLLLLACTTPSNPPAPSSTPGPVSSAVVAAEARPNSGDEFAVFNNPQLATDHFLFFQTEGASLPPLPLLQEQSEAIYGDVAARLSLTTTVRIEVIFFPPDPTPCPVRGRTIARVPSGDEDRPPFRVLIYSDSQTDTDQILGVLAHEVAHALMMDGQLQPGQRGLSEGFASWAAGPYQTAWYGIPSYDALVQDTLAAGRYLPLHLYQSLAEPSPEGGAGPASCLEQRDQLYAQWASFVGFLIERDGFETFQALVQSTWQEGAAVFGRPPAYEQLYGAPLRDLEHQWLDQLDG